MSNSGLAELVKEYLEETSVEQTKNVKASKNVKNDLVAERFKLEVDKFNGSGIEVPDLLTKSGLNSLNDWNESDEKLPTVKTVLVKSSWIKVKKVENKLENTISEEPKHKSDESEK